MNKPTAQRIDRMYEAGSGGCFMRNLETWRLRPSPRERPELFPMQADDKGNGTEGKALQKAMCVLFLRQHTAPLHCKADVPERGELVHEERPDQSPPR